MAPPKASHTQACDFVFLEPKVPGQAEKRMRQLREIREGLV